MPSCGQDKESSGRNTALRWGGGGVTAFQSVNAVPACWVNCRAGTKKPVKQSVITLLTVVLNVRVSCVQTGRRLVLAPIAL